MAWVAMAPPSHNVVPPLETDTIEEDYSSLVLNLISSVISNSYLIWSILKILQLCTLLYTYTPYSLPTSIYICVGMFNLEGNYELTSRCILFNLILYKFINESFGDIYFFIWMLAILLCEKFILNILLKRDQQFKLGQSQLKYSLTF